MLVIFALTIDVAELARSIAAVKPIWLMTAVALGVLNISLKAERWRLMVKRIAQTEMTRSYAFASVFAGVAGSSLLPGRAFEVTKPMMLRASHDIPLRLTFPAVLFERLLDLATLFAVFLVSAIVVSPQIRFNHNVLFIIAGIGFICLLVVVVRPRFALQLVGRATKRFARLAKVSNAIASVERVVVVWQQRESQGRSLALTAAAMLAEVGRAYAMFAAFNITLSPALVAFAFSGSILVGLLSLIPGGVGVTETSQFGFLSVLLPNAPGTALQGAILLDRFISYYLLIAIGALVLLFNGRARRIGYGVTAPQASSNSEVAKP